MLIYEIMIIIRKKLFEIYLEFSKRNKYNISIAALG
jgi:hypothetical protein